MTPLFRVLTPMEALRLGLRYMVPRRWLCVALVLASLVAGGFLNGCATGAAISAAEALRTCDIRSDYRNTRAGSRSGRVVVAWAFDQGFPDRRYGETMCRDGACIVRLGFAPPTANQLCELAKVGHEIAIHAMDGSHE